MRTTQCPLDPPYDEFKPFHLRHDFNLTLIGVLYSLGLTTQCPPAWPQIKHSFEFSDSLNWSHKFDTYSKNKVDRILTIVTTIDIRQNSYISANILNHYLTLAQIFIISFGGGLMRMQQANNVHYRDTISCAADNCHCHCLFQDVNKLHTTERTRPVFKDQKRLVGPTPANGEHHQHFSIMTVAHTFHLLQWEIFWKKIYFKNTNPTL